MHDQRTTIAKKVSVTTIVWNVALSILKIIAGIIGNSAAMIADGFHSVSDVASTILAMLGIYMAGKRDDDDHQYGHEKMEPVMGKLLATVLFLTGVGIIYSAIKHIQGGNIETPSLLPLVAALVSIVVKEWMYRYTIHAARIIESSALKADAWHHRTDALSSVGALIGVAGARAGYHLLDPIVSIGIGALIIKVAVDIYVQSVKELIDTAADDATVEEIRSIAEEVHGVCRVDLLKTRIHGNRIYVDVEIAVNRDLPLHEAHDIAEEVHDQLERSIRRIKHCMVHVNPCSDRIKKKE